jgi:release factor glutamine methyltransferase
VFGTDVSEEALAVARANAARLELDVAFVRADLLGGLTAPLDAVVSNPPYGPDEEPLPADVDLFEPRIALRAGGDGLDVIRALVPQAAARAPFLALEIGAGQADAVVALCRAAGYAEVETRPDLAGIARVVVARR